MANITITGGATLLTMDYAASSSTNSVTINGTLTTADDGSGAYLAVKRLRPKQSQYTKQRMVQTGLK
jgi:hypothetical protein